MNPERFDELLSLYVDGRASDPELGELENGLRSDPARRRDFVDRIRLDVGLTSLFETALAQAPARPIRQPRRVTLSTSPMFRPAFAVAAALFIVALLLLVFRDRGQAPVEERTTPAIPVEEARRTAEEEHAGAERQQRKTEERVAELQRQEAAVVREEGPKAPTDAALARLRAEREAAEQDLKEAQQRERVAAEKVERLTNPPLAPVDKAVTRTQLATLERFEGEVRVVGRPALVLGQGIYPGDRVESAGPRSFAILSYPDRTRLEIGGETIVREIAEARIFLEKGSIKAEVARQPKDRPLIFATPHGDARVLGTVLRVSVDPDPKHGTSLEVQEGKVELRNPAGKSVLVEAGYHAAIVAGAPTASKPLPREEILLAMDFEDGKLPASVSTGSVEAGPARPGNRYCLAGVSEPSGAAKVFLGDGGFGLFTFNGDEVLNFDYWTDTQASQVNFNLWDRSQKIAHEGAVPKLVLGKWTHATIRLADLGDPGTRLREGDWVASLYLQSTGGAGATRRLYLDNVTITRSRTLKPKAK